MSKRKWSVSNMLGSWTQKPAGEESFVAGNDRDTTTVYTKDQLSKMLHGYAAACQHAISNGVAGLDIVAKDPKTKKILANSKDIVDKAFSCQLTRLTRQDLLYKLTSDLTMSGNAYLAYVGSGLEYVSGNVTVKEWFAYDGIVSAVKTYNVDTLIQSVTQDIPAERLIHFKYRLLDGAASGRGSLEDCNLEADTVIEVSRFMRGYFKNFALPGLHVTVAKTGMKAGAFQKFAEKLQAQFGGKNRGGTFVTSDGIKAAPIGNSIVDNKAVDVMAAMKVIICGVYGVPVDVIDSTNTNRATAQASIKMFHQNTVMPIAWAICDRMNQAYDYVIFEPVPYDTVDSLEGDKLIVTLVEKGVLTKEEARVRLRTVSLEDGKAVAVK